MYSSTQTGATYCKHDGRGHGRLLDSEIVEVVGGGQPEDPEQKELHQVAAAHAQRRLDSLARRMGARISSAKVLRLCARTSGSIEGRT